MSDPTCQTESLGGSRRKPVCRSQRPHRAPLPTGFRTIEPVSERTRSVVRAREGNRVNADRRAMELVERGPRWQARDSGSRPSLKLPVCPLWGRFLLVGPSTGRPEEVFPAGD